MTVSRSIYTVFQHVTLVVVSAQSHFATLDSLQSVRARPKQSIFRVDNRPVPQRPQIRIVHNVLHEISILHTFGRPFRQLFIVR
jgi:hypothetical protein